MDINSIQGAGAYGAALQQTDNTLIKDQNRLAAEPPPTSEDSSAIQQAFKVSITQEARAAADNKNSLQTTQTPPVALSQPSEQDQGTGNRQPGNPIVDIVA